MRLFLRLQIFLVTYYVPNTAPPPPLPGGLPSVWLWVFVCVRTGRGEGGGLCVSSCVVVHDEMRPDNTKHAGRGYE